MKSKTRMFLVIVFLLPILFLSLSSCGEIQWDSPEEVRIQEVECEFGDGCEVEVKEIGAGLYSEDIEIPICKRLAQRLHGQKTVTIYPVIGGTFGIHYGYVVKCPFTGKASSRGSSN